MAKEKFLIVATPQIDDCFGRFSETANREAISAGAMDETDAYSWIEKSFTIELRRYREATHICSFTPSAHYVWLQNAFVGIPNAKWEYDGDPEGLENESGGEFHGYGTYRDEYDPRFICETFTLDTVKVLGMRKPRRGSRDEETYRDAIWEAAEEAAREMACNGLHAPILDAYTYRQWERQRLEAIRARSLAESRRHNGVTL